jgi:hypothetical protein
MQIAKIETEVNGEERVHTVVLTDAKHPPYFTEHTVMLFGELQGSYSQPAQWHYYPCVNVRRVSVETRPPASPLPEWLNRSQTY